MKIILHMGTPKTGSTSLQSGLGELKRHLRQDGFHYPDPPAEFDDSHHVLIALLELPDYLARRKKSQSRPFADNLRLAKRFLADARKDAEAAGCHTIVLSSELIFPKGGDEVFTLQRHLREISTDIEPVVYIREPASWYKSSLQQEAKTLHFLAPKNHRRIRRPLELIEEAFGRKPTVRAFDREQLTGGDILHDFHSDVLGLKPPASGLPRKRDNQALSAEATRALLFHGDYLRSTGQDLSRKRAMQIRRRIHALDGDGTSTTALTLKRELVDTIRRSAVEYLWLRDTYGIAFNDLDYDDIDPKVAEELDRFAGPEDVFACDQGKLVRLLLRVMYDLCDPRQVRPRDARRRRTRRRFEKITGIWTSLSNFLFAGGHGK